MLAGNKLSASRSGNNDGQGTVLVGGTIAQPGTVSKHNIIQQSLAIGFLYPIHPVAKIGKLLHIEIVDFDEIINISALIMGHHVMALGLIK